MCRILLLINQKKPEISNDLAIFQELAKNGNVPNGFSNGHQDGWGIGGFKNGKFKLLRKEGASAFRSLEYENAVSATLQNNCDVVVGHLRKSSIGGISIENTHPFYYGGLLFCQNGTIFNSEKLKLRKKFETYLRGKTDSERFFIYLLQCIDDNKNKKVLSAISREGILKAISFVRKKLDYTALNFVLTDGKFIWVLREVNEKNKIVREKKMMDYYTLFRGIGIKNNLAIVSSEKLAIRDISWEHCRNHELQEINIESGGISVYYC